MRRRQQRRQQRGTNLVVGSSGQFFGSEEALRRLLAPLASTGEARVTMRSMSYWEATLRWAGCDELTECRRRGHAVFAAKSHYAERPFSRAAIDRLVASVERRQTTGVAGRGSVLLDSYGGAIARVPVAATAFAHRKALFSLQYLTYDPQSVFRFRQSIRPA